MKALTVALSALLYLAGEVSGHANMVWPYTWMDGDTKYGMQSGKQCASGPFVPGHYVVPGCMWFTNYTFIPGEPTLDESMRSYQNVKYGGVEYDLYKTNPWRSPGAAFIHSGCGVAGGNPYGCPVDGPEGNCPGGGFGYGPFAENFDFPNVQVTEWKAGSTVEAAWGIIANHGGGYSYRLCKVPAEGMSGITEECFQETPLRFAGDTQWVQYGEDASTRVDFPAHRTDVGTTPTGSQWTRNPIPACNDPSGGYMEPEDMVCPQGTQFEPPLPGLFGYGETSKAPGQATFMFSIGDYLEVPEQLEPGDYVLSFRWDCEQTSQVWATCSSIKIVN